MMSQDNQSIRILLIDDQTIVREGLRMLLDSQSGMTVVGEASDPLEATSLAQREQPDLIILDLDLGNASGLDCLEKLNSVASKSKVLVLTGLSDLNQHLLAISTGAVGVVNKLEASEALIKAIRKVHSGEAWLDDTLTARLLEEFWSLQKSRNSPRAYSFPRSENQFAEVPHSAETQVPPEENAKIALLTEREKEVVVLIGEGLRNQQIADRLSISIITVRHHLSSIFSKLSVSDRFELAIYAYRHGLAKLPS